MMRALRLHGTNGIEDLAIDEVELGPPAEGEALVRVHAAALTRDELDWPVDRLPAVPSYELSGTVVDAAPRVTEVSPGDEVFALTGFDRDGVAADYSLVPARFLAQKPQSLGHVESAAIPLAGLSAWQALFEHGGLQAGERVLVHGATGGVGHLATQLAHRRGAYVIGTVSGPDTKTARELGADEVVDRSSTRFEDAVDDVDLIFDTVGGDVLVRSAEWLREGGRLVSVAEEPPDGSGGTYFVVEPNRAQLGELARLADEGVLHPAVDSIFDLDDARAAFERVSARGKSGKVVLRVAAAQAAPSASASRASSNAPSTPARSPSAGATT